MNATGYKILGYTVWHGGRWYLRRAYAQRVASMRRYALLGGLLALLLGGAVALITRRG